MKKSQRLQIEQSEIREGMTVLLDKDELTAEDRSALEGKTGRMKELEVELRAALTAEGVDEAESRQADDGMTPEQRERFELRGKATVGGYLKAALTGRMVSGAEAELAQAAGVDGIPIELWDVPRAAEPRAAGAEQRDITPAPMTGTGVNLDPIQPAIFAPSIAPRLMIEMPMVSTGGYSSMTISASVTADSVAKSGSVPETAGTLTPTSTTPHRIGASLALTLEDIASVGHANFEAMLRDNVSLALADHVDSEMLNGTGGSNELTGVLQRLTNASNPAANVETWTRFLAIQSSGIEGLWATELEHIAIVAGVDTYRLAAATFQGTDSEESAASYLKRMGADFWTNKRMPAKASNIQKGILCRKGRSGVRTAVCPHWGSVSIDDIYSGRLKGERFFTVSVLLGDVILVQPDAYKEVAFRVS